jgi:hypothetical protein
MTQKQEKVAARLAIRIANTPNKSGYKTPGSMNKKKTGYAKKSK